MQSYEQLEVEIAKWAGYAPEQVVCCNSGTAALHLALEAFRLSPRSAVLVPDFTFIACARAVTLAGLDPVFVDCDERLLMDVGLAANYSRDHLNCQAIMAVHIHGRKLDMDRIHSFAVPKCNDMWVVEDLAEAHGIQPHQETDAATWSFNRTKVIAGEEGGAVAFRNVEHATYARLLRSQGNRGDWDHAPRGMNYRMQNCSAELVSKSLKFVDHELKLRRQIETWYDELCLTEWKMPERQVPWVYDLRLPSEVYGDRVGQKAAQALRDAGIEARCGFRPMRLQMEYGFPTSQEEERSKIASKAYKAACEVIALPIQPRVTTRASCARAFEILQKVVG